MTANRDLLFGTDLRLLERSGSLDLVGDSVGDLTLSHGAETISQALTLRLLIRRGALARLGWPDYGSRLHELTGEPNNQRTQVLAMAYARAAVEEDPRVKEITMLRASADPGDRTTVHLEMEVELITENTPLNLVFDVRLA
jgi:phage gp46-like protein